jgi:cytochrome c-type biogenesis protein
MPKALQWVGLGCLATIVIVVFNYVRPVSLLEPLQNLVFGLEEPYYAWFNRQSPSHPFLLIPLAFFGGLLASISPCILALLPVNLSYIGTRDITSRRDAIWKAGLFVFGVSTVLSLFGLFSALAGLVMVQFQGIVLAIVGLVIGLMGLSMLGVLNIPLPQTNIRLPFTNPYSVGVTFALVTSPCTSPLMFAVLAAGAATGSQVQSVLTMISYSLGYTIVIFFASVFTGLVKQTRWLLPRSELFMRIGGVILFAAGTYYLSNGVRWMVAIASSP